MNEEKNERVMVTQDGPLPEGIVTARLPKTAASPDDPSTWSGAYYDESAEAADAICKKIAREPERRHEYFDIIRKLRAMMQNDTQAGKSPGNPEVPEGIDDLQLSRFQTRKPSAPLSCPKKIAGALQ